MQSFLKRPNRKPDYQHKELRKNFFWFEEMVHLFNRDGFEGSLEYDCLTKLVDRNGRIYYDDGHPDNEIDPETYRAYREWAIERIILNVENSTETT